MRPPGWRSRGFSSPSTCASPLPRVVVKPGNRGAQCATRGRTREGGTWEGGVDRLNFGPECRALPRARMRSLVPARCEAERSPQEQADGTPASAGPARALGVVGQQAVPARPRSPAATGGGPAGRWAVASPPGPLPAPEGGALDRYFDARHRPAHRSLTAPPPPTGRRLPWPRAPEPPRQVGNAAADGCRRGAATPPAGHGQPSMRWGTPSGFPSRSASGSSEAGKFWKATGRRNRVIDAVPTAVVVGAVVAGYGPPCCCA